METDILIIYWLRGMYIARDSIFKNQKPGHMTTFMWWGGEQEEKKNLTSLAMKNER
jgi:hypothetical protein